ncbi:MAG TPA: DUF1810 domain-containing protein [Allosphingosinicella sp.]|nr:DUF1810 domain-containing protein [Allosphingosinicella sp.]
MGRSEGAKYRTGEEKVVHHDDLDRFVEAQAGNYERALAEIISGQKRSHWMWYILPQLAGLGHSAMAQRYAIRDLGEARAYLAHPILGQRLRTVVGALQDLTGTTALAVFGAVDAMKLRSSLTLFAAATAEPLFSAALQRWFANEPDERTLRLLGQTPPP